MDGDADVTATEQPTLFNQQVGEFVGGTDKNASPYDYPAASGLPRARYLFRETRRREDLSLIKSMRKPLGLRGAPKRKEESSQSLAGRPGGTCATTTTSTSV